MKLFKCTDEYIVVYGIACFGCAKYISIVIFTHHFIGII